MRNKVLKLATWKYVKNIIEWKKPSRKHPRKRKVLPGRGALRRTGGGRGDEGTHVRIPHREAASDTSPPTFSQRRARRKRRLLIPRALSLPTS